MLSPVEHAMNLDSTTLRAQNKRRTRSQSSAGREGEMSPREFQKFKEAAAKIDREYSTPEKAREWLIKIGYLNPDGQLAEKYK
jgi:hypothetical protein